ncbi:hypothetical protein [Acinetobacter johnsonii]|uniref:hypothetical protein n=1 Tax=Acinetobacter johnsonii TaxID=40214 RepID=UPI002448A489|nr:hypothetical protein [Acinetobacter johnsonii]MDH1706268.1 hypothetical protein [Acinetobacter johnsonii]
MNVIVSNCCTVFSDGETFSEFSAKLELEMKITPVVANIGKSFLDIDIEGGFFIIYKQ